MHLIYNAIFLIAVYQTALIHSGQTFEIGGCTHFFLSDDSFEMNNLQRNVLSRFYVERFFEFSSTLVCVTAMYQLDVKSASVETAIWRKWLRCTEGMDKSDESDVANNRYARRIYRRRCHVADGKDGENS